MLVSTYIQADFERYIGEYIEIFFSDKFHLSGKHWYIANSQVQKGKIQTIPSESEEITIFVKHAKKWEWG